MQVDNGTNRGLFGSSLQNLFPLRAETVPENPQIGNETPATLGSLFSKPASDSPWWVLPILTFVVGIAITAALLRPGISTPEFQRGHAVGYKAGMDDATRQWYDVGFRDGKSGRYLAP